MINKLWFRVADGYCEELLVGKPATEGSPIGQLPVPQTGAETIEISLRIENIFHWRFPTRC